MKAFVISSSCCQITSVSDYLERVRINRSLRVKGTKRKGIKYKRGTGESKHDQRTLSSMRININHAHDTQSLGTSLCHYNCLCNVT